MDGSGNGSGDVDVDVDMDMNGDMNVDIVRIQNPTADGGLEIISTSWIHPRDLFAAFRRGDLALFPPQYYLLTTLADLLDSMYQGGSNSNSNSNNRTEVLRASIGAFGTRLFNPRPSGFTDQGGRGQRPILSYEGDELRGGKAGDRHRCLILYHGKVSRRAPISSLLLIDLSPNRRE